MKQAIIILAAGAASRMGAPKMLLKKNGQTVLDILLDKTAQLHAETILVTGAHSLPAQSVRTIKNPDWQKGMSVSIKKGIEALPASVEKILILLADQPDVSLSHMQGLLNAAEPGVPAATDYGNFGGVPAAFTADYFEPLCNLSGDGGAKKLLASKEAFRLKPDCSLRDLDTPEDYERWLTE